MQENWKTKSNRESGDGYVDILIRPDTEDVGIVIELKYDSDLNRACENALKQIEDRRYVEELRNDCLGTIYKYGIGFHKKACKVMLGE